MTPEADKKFNESINSFRPITPEEAKLAQPLHIRLALAGPGDNAATLAEKMVLTDRPVQQFQLLNGLDGDQLKSGETYKIVRLLSAVAAAKTKKRRAFRPAAFFLSVV